MVASAPLRLSIMPVLSTRCARLCISTERINISPRCAGSRLLFWTRGKVSGNQTRHIPQPPWCISLDLLVSLYILPSTIVTCGHPYQGSVTTLGLAFQYWLHLGSGIPQLQRPFVCHRINGSTLANLATADSLRIRFTLHHHHPSSAGLAG